MDMVAGIGADADSGQLVRADLVEKGKRFDNGGVEGDGSDSE